MVTDIIKAIDQMGRISYLLVMGLGILAVYYWKRYPSASSKGY
jgi:hypothetical protein